MTMSKHREIKQGKKLPCDYCSGTYFPKGIKGHELGHRHRGDRRLRDRNGLLENAEALGAKTLGAKALGAKTEARTEARRAGTRTDGAILILEVENGAVIGIRYVETLPDFLEYLAAKNT